MSAENEKQNHAITETKDIKECSLTERLNTTLPYAMTQGMDRRDLQLYLERIGRRNMKEQMRIELHNETEYTERISFQDIWTHASRLKYAGCRVAAITDRNSVDGIHMAEHDFMRRGIHRLRRNAQLHRC